MAVGNESTPVYIDDDGIARECTAVTPSGTTASIKRFQSTADATGQYTWFEVWPDGWVKQGGCVKVTSGAGNQVTVTFPVEFRDMLYQPHVSTTDMSAGYSEPATPVGTGNEHSLGRCTTSTMCLQVQSGYSTSQMFFWTAEGYRNPLKDIPTGYTETAISLTGVSSTGGGVIDGTQFTDTYKIVPYTTWTDDTKKNSDGEWEYKYEVQNDCLFYANFLVHANAGATDLVTIKLNDVIFDYYSENQGNASAVGTYFQTLQLPLKKGTVVKFCSKSKPNHNQVFNITDAKIEAFAIKHAEYKLTAIAPQVAFPDWDTNKKENVTVFPYTVSKNGYLYICVANVGSEAYVYVNGQEVHYACTASYGDSCGVVPVSKGDVVTVGGSFASAAVHSVTFYPAKVIQQEGSSSSGGFVGMDLARATAVALPYQATEDGWFNVEMNSTSTSGYIQLSEDGTNWVNIICTRSSDTHIVPMCKGQWVRGSSLNIRSGGIGPQFIPAKKSS